MSTLRDETLADLLNAFWRARLYLIIGAIIGFACAAIIITFSIPHMRIIMIVSPSIDMGAPLSDNGASQSTSKLETLPFLRYLKILSGPNVVKQILSNNPNVKKALQNTRRFSFQSANNMDSTEDISAYLTKEIVIKPVGDTPLRVIELEHPNAGLAQQLLLKLHETADQLLRQEMMMRTQNRLDYLKQTIAKTANPEHRQALTTLLMEQERLSMMIRMDRYFAATLVEPPYIYPRAVWPRKSYLFPIMVLAGMLMGWIIFGVIHTYNTTARTTDI